MPCAYIHYGYDLNSPIRFGESDKSKRVCRFCGKSMPSVTFRKKAHAISENIGNKFFINNEECDACNDFFSKIEEDFYKLNAISLSYLNIKGKNGSRKIKMSDGEIFSKNGIWILHPKETPDVVFDETGVGSLNINLQGNALSFTPSNIYKALVKYFIGCIESKYLKYYATTKFWLLNSTGIVQTPPVIQYRCKPVNHPRFAYYIRQDTISSFPHSIGCLEFADVGYFFLVPFANSEIITTPQLRQFRYIFHSIFGNRPHLLLPFSDVQVNSIPVHINISNIIPNKTQFSIPLD